MKKLLTYALLAAVLFGNSGAGCGSNGSDDPQPENIKLVVGGLWEVTETFTVDPNDKITLKIKKGALGFKFYSDGKAESCSFGVCGTVGRWSFLKESETNNLFTIHFSDPNQKELFGEHLSGPVGIVDDNHIAWTITGNPTIGTTDATYMRWTMERNP